MKIRLLDENESPSSGARWATPTGLRSLHGIHLGPAGTAKSEPYGIIWVQQAVRDSEAARRPRLVVALHSDHCRRRADLGYPRE
jgi:hypothetical protein